MIITHKHTLVISPNNLESHNYVERFKAEIEGCKVYESTAAIVVEWSEMVAVTTVEGAES